MRKFLALPIEEKATHAARALAKLKNELVGELEEEGEEESEKKKSLKQIRSKAAFPKQTRSTHKLKITTAKEGIVGVSLDDCDKTLSLMTKRSEILKMEKAIAKEERKLKQLEKLIERDNQKFEEFLRENERKSVEARALWISVLCFFFKLLLLSLFHSELEKYEDALTDYLKYKDFLFRLSPPEWQDEKKSKDSKAKTLSEQNDGQEVEPTETGIWNNNLDKPELYFTDPQQLLDLMSELTEQNLSLIQNSARVGEGLEKLRQTVDTTRRKIENEEEKIALQIKELNQKLDKEKARGTKLEQMVQLHVSLSSQDQDEMLDALDEKVTEVYSACVENRITDLSTLQKVAKIESRVFSLLQSLEGMPVERLAVVKKVKDSEKRSRMREEKLMEQREKQKERMKRYLERSLADSKKIVRLIPLISQSITAATSKSF
uniref:Cilia and flagella associated protein 100 n=1 Tax=Poecilia latipinna TaxID=48699 RepID=A0A3B3V8J7_9TELE